MLLTAVTLKEIVSIALLSMGVGIEVTNIFFATNVLEVPKVIDINILLFSILKHNNYNRIVLSRFIISIMYFKLQRTSE